MRTCLVTFKDSKLPCLEVRHDTVIVLGIKEASVFINHLTLSWNPGDIHHFTTVSAQITITSTPDVIYVDLKIQQLHSQLLQINPPLTRKCWQRAVSFGCSAHVFIWKNSVIHHLALSSNSFQKLPPHRTSCPTEVKHS